MTTYVVLDLETTGLDHIMNQITQLAAIKYNEDGVEVGRINTYVKLKKNQIISPYTPFITEELLDTGIEEYQLSSLFNSFVGDSILVIQYAPFDLSFMTSKGGYKHKQDFYCTRTLAKIVDPKGNPSLKYLAEKYGIENKNHHDAVNDCEVAFAVFRELQKELGHELEYWKNSVMDFNDRPLRFIPEGAKILVEQEFNRGY